MGVIVTVPKEVVDHPEFGKLTRPHTHAKSWQVIEEREYEFVIEILEE
ncbi:hypothetical protein ACFVSW_20255 [Neobacillus sp. NPDC058068]